MAASSPRRRHESAQTPKKEVCAPKFLAAFRNGGVVRAACEAAGIDRRTYYNWRRDDPEFDAACSMADEEATDVLEAEGIMRARKSSDLLLIFFLKAKRPAKYRERHEQQAETMTAQQLIEALTGKPLAALEKETAAVEETEAGDE